MLDLNFQPKFEDLLEAIPFTQFKISSDPPMRGSRGVVFRGMMQNMERFPTGDPQVALKAISDATPEDVSDIMRELDATFTALQGFTVRAVKFIGVTKSPPRIPDTCPLPSNFGNTLFLVSEYALEGSGFECVQRVLKGVDQDWDPILRFIGDLASGLNSIHSRGVIHR